MKSFISLLFVSSLFIISCKSDREIKDSITPKNVVPFTVVGNQMKSDSQTTQTTQTQQTVPTPATTNTTVTAAGMNPAHGQPGHRCEIPVGAPLNTSATVSKPQNTVSPAPSAPTVTTSATPSATTAVQSAPTAEGMNPPHGLANHRCDIAVGAPLPKA